jgi:pimeloyl-ACP methyl ester carboxylesterase
LRDPGSVPFDSFEDLQQIDVPTLILGNDDDRIHPFEYAKRLAASIPSAPLQEIPSKAKDVEGHQRELRGCVAEFLSTVI